MDLHKKKIIDVEEALPNEQHEAFVQEYFRLDVDGEIVNDKARRIKAYKVSFPEAKSDDDGQVNGRASTLMKRADVKGRLEHLYEEHGSGVENKYRWTKAKSENALVELVFGDGVKIGDRLKAMDMLNKMNGLDVPKLKEEDSSKGKDTVESFFDKFRGKTKE